MSHYCMLCGKAYRRITRLFQHLRNEHDVDVMDAYVDEYMESDNFTPDQIKRMWENYWTGKD